MSKRPFIGLNCDAFRDADSGITGVRTPYVEAVRAAGGWPLLAPWLVDAEAVGAFLDRVEGVVMIGGDDLRPDRLGVAAGRAVRPVTEERDRADFGLLKEVLARRMPLLAICLACQELNVALGGTIWQDLASEAPPSEIAHAIDGPSRLTDHGVAIKPGSRLSQVWEGAEEGWINSSHHQAIRRLGRGLRAVAWAPDGIVEAIELEGHPFCLGVQWHPERTGEDPRQRKLFAALVQACLN